MMNALSSFIKVIKNKLDNQTPGLEQLSGKYFSKVCYGLIFLIVLILFVENFVFSDSFLLLRFRTIDDVAFQDTLRRVHLLIESSQYSKIWEINDYAYGWVFWASLSFVTYPLYLLSTYGGIDWPLIVAPRQISLLFSVMSLVFLSKMLREMEFSEKERAVALLTFTLFPTFGFFSLSFGTVSAVMFFSILSIYLAIHDNPSSLKGRVWIALSLAAAGGVKLSGLLIAPLVFLLVVFRYQGRSLTIILRDLLVASVVFCFSIVVFSNPALLLSYVYPDIAIKYWQILAHFMAATHIASNSDSNFYRFFWATSSSFTHFFVTLMFIVGMFIFFLREKKVRLDLAAVAFVVVLAGLYLGLTVKNGSSIGVYFTAVSFLFLLGVAGWARTRQGVLILVLLPSLLFLDLVVREYEDLKIKPAINDMNSARWNHLTYFTKNINLRDRVSSAVEISKCMGVSENRAWAGHVFIDFTVPTGFNSLSFPKSCVSIAWNNLSPAGKYCDRPVDFLVLDKLAPGRLPRIEFDKTLAAADEKLVEGIKNDRASRFELSENGMFNDQQFKRICDLPFVEIFEAVK